MSAENKAIIRTFFESQDRNERIPPEFLAPGFTAHLPGAQTMDADQYQAWEAAFFISFTNIQHIIEDMLSEDDQVAFRMTLKVTHSNEFMSIPATNTDAAVDAIGVMRLADGKIAEFWGAPDTMSLMQQIGALPTPDGAPVG